MVNTSSCLFTVYLDPFCCCLSDNSFSGAIKETEICRPLPTFLNFTRRGQRTGSTKSCLPPHTNTATRQPSNWVDRYQSNRKPFHTPTHTHTHTHANIRATTKGEIVPRYIPWVCLWVYILYVPWCEHYCDAPLRLFHLRSPLLIHAQACKHTHVNTHWHTHTHTHTPSSAKLVAPPSWEQYNKPVLLTAPPPQPQASRAGSVRLAGLTQTRPLLGPCQEN